MKEAPTIVGAGLEIRRPSFRVGELRRVGDLYFALTRTIRNGEIAFANPIWSEARRDLACLGEKLSGAVLTAIRSGALSSMPQPDSHEGACAVEHVFGLRRREHLLRVEPIVWANFTEPQFTKGLAHFVNAPQPKVRIGRAQALLAALGVRTGEGLEGVEVKAEVGVAEGRRIDLLVEWTDVDAKCHAAAVEAKIGHKITSGQLNAYRDHLAGGRSIAGDVHLVVVSPRYTNGIAESLREHPEWRWISWRGLLVAHERALRVEYDDQAYRQFRSTLWRRTE